jgi:hypothetical protein
MTAKEFDRRFDNGEDIDTLMGNGEVLTMEELKKIVKEKEEIAKNRIVLDLNDTLIQKLKEKANLLNIKIDDLIKLILAERLGII